MIFQAQLGYIIPGNFVGWRIYPIPGIKTPTIPDNYTVEGASDALDQLDITICQYSPFTAPSVCNGGSLETAVFEIEKYDRKKFRVLRYIGELQVEHKIIPKEDK